MEKEKEVDSILVDGDGKRKKIWVKRLFLISLGLLLINTITLTFILPHPEKGIYNLDGTPTSSDEIGTTIFTSILIGIPVFCFILSIFVSLVPFQKMKYSNKVLRVFLILLIIVNGPIAVLGVIRLISAGIN